MSRRRRAERRPTPPDPRYNSVEVSRLVNRLMRRGKKSVAQRIVYQAMDIMQQETKRDALEVLKQAMENARPLLEVKPRRVGGATYQVPVEVRPERSEALAMRWLLTSAQGRKGQPMNKRLAVELIEAARGEGTAVKKREDIHKMAEANRAFVHYRW
ncbi:MAG: 30S ribosomal protein S7 [SAR202 cluster bacterium]|nr:30S ribosomal protein S7 [SAR202 cluster bacterium]